MGMRSLRRNCQDPSSERYPGGKGLLFVVTEQRDVSDVVDGVRNSPPNPRAVDSNRRDALAVAGDQAPESKRRFLQRDESHVRRTARIAIRSKGRILLVEPIELVSVQAQGNYVLLQQQMRSHRLRGSISVMAERLGLMVSSVFIGPR
jgi:hypothetical protein